MGGALGGGDVGIARVAQLDRSTTIVEGRRGDRLRVEQREQQIRGRVGRESGEGQRERRGRRRGGRSEEEAGAPKQLGGGDAGARIGGEAKE